MTLVTVDNRTLTPVIDTAAAGLLSGSTSKSIHTPPDIKSIQSRGLFGKAMEIRYSHFYQYWECICRKIRELTT